MANLILSKKGETINLTDSTDNKVKTFALYGKATQKQYSGKNLINNTAVSRVINGITYTVNDDGSVKANGTNATSNPANITIADITLIAGEQYVLSGGSENVRVVLYYLSDYTKLNKFTNESQISISIPIDGTYRMYASVIAGTTANNETIYPMLSVEGGEYEPYVGGTPSPNPDYPQEIEVAGASGSVEVTTSNEENTKSTTATISTPNGLAGIKVNSGGNYTDENGQQWICDSIVKYADGTGKYVQRIGVIDSYNGESVTTDYMSTTGQLTTGAKVLYVLPELIITDLSAEEIAEIEKLQTFYPVTNISNDAGCGMEISYVSTKQNMQVKALLSGVETTFTDLGNNVFEAVLTAPNHDGLYEIEINAVSQTGDTTSATVDLTVASWVTPKVNWLPTDRLNIQDFNRIRNNMIALWELLQWEFGHFTIEDMGDELTEYTGRWNVNHFNAFEKNLEIFRTLLPIDDFGLTQTFYYNSMLIKYDELNRIENLLLRFKQYATSREAGIRKLPFRLGAFREVRI